MKGSEGLEGSCRRVTKPWQAQPITFFSRQGKDLTHREAQPLEAELVQGGRCGVGRWDSSRSGGEAAQAHSSRSRPGIWMVSVQVGTGASPGFCSHNTLSSHSCPLRS